CCWFTENPAEPALRRGTPVRSSSTPQVWSVRVALVRGALAADCLGTPSSAHAAHYRDAPKSRLPVSGQATTLCGHSPSRCNQLPPKYISARRPARHHTAHRV